MANKYLDIVGNKKPGEEETPYDLSVKDAHGDKSQQFQASINAAVNKDPDRMAEADKLAKELNLPVAVVEKDFDRFNKLKKSNETTYSDYVNKAPGVARYLQDPVNASISHDDLDKLVETELALKEAREEEPSFSEDLFKASKTGYHDMASSVYFLSAAFGMSDLDDTAELIAESVRKSNELRAASPDYVKEFDKVMEEEGRDVDEAVWDLYRLTVDENLDRSLLETAVQFTEGSGKVLGEIFDQWGAALARPKGLTYKNLETLANSAPSIATGIAGGFGGAQVGAFAGVSGGLPGIAAGATIGSVAGFGSGIFVGSAAIEIGAEIRSELSERGIDLTDPQQIAGALRDPTLMEDVRARALRKGLTTGAVDAMFATLTAGMSRLGKPVAGTAQVVKQEVKETAIETFGEGLGEFAGQTAREKGDLSKVSIGESINESIISFGQSAVTSVAGGTIGVAREQKRKRTEKKIKEKFEQVKKAHKALKTAKALEDAGEAVKNSKTLQRNPEKVKEMVQQTFPEGKEQSVYFQEKDWDAIWNGKGISPAQAAEDVGGESGALSYRESKATGSLIEFKVSDFIAKLAKEEFYNEILAVTRTTEDGSTVAESIDLFKNIPQDIEQLAKEAKEQIELDQKEQEQFDQVVTGFESQLRAAGESNPELKAQVMTGRFFKTMAKRAGLSIPEFMEKFPLRITRGEQALEGERVRVADQLEFERQSLEIKRQAGERITAEDEKKVRDLEEKLKTFDTRTFAQEGPARFEVKDAQGKIHTFETREEAQEFVDKNFQTRKGVLERSDGPFEVFGQDFEDQSFETLEEARAFVRAQEQFADTPADDHIFLPGEGDVLAEFFLEGQFQPTIDEVVTVGRAQQLGLNSKLQQTIADKMGNKATIEQVRALIRPDKGIKQEEVKWSGIESFLKVKEDAGVKKIDKAELLEYLKANEMTLEAVVRGGPLQPNLAKLREIEQTINVRDQNIKIQIAELRNFYRVDPVAAKSFNTRLRIFIDEIRKEGLSDLKQNEAYLELKEEIIEATGETKSQTAPARKAFDLIEKKFTEMMELEGQLAQAEEDAFGPENKKKLDNLLSAIDIEQGILDDAIEAQDKKRSEVVDLGDKLRKNLDKKKNGGWFDLADVGIAHDEVLNGFDNVQETMDGHVERILEYAPEAEKDLRKWISLREELHKLEIKALEREHEFKIARAELDSFKRSLLNPALRAKHEGFSQGGGEDYREVLFRLKSAQGFEAGETIEDLTELPAAFEVTDITDEETDAGNYEVLWPDGRHLTADDSEQLVRDKALRIINEARSKWTLSRIERAITEINDFVRQIPENQLQRRSDILSWRDQLKRDRALKEKRKEEFVEPAHFEETSIVAHVRAKTRTTPDGKKVFFLEELQSDWHDKGSKSGYRSDVDTGMAEQLPSLEQELKDFKRKLIADRIGLLTLDDFEDRSKRSSTRTDYRGIMDDRDFELIVEKITQEGDLDEFKVLIGEFDGNFDGIEDFSQPKMDHRVKQKGNRTYVVVSPDGEIVGSYFEKENAEKRAEDLTNKLVLHEEYDFYFRGALQQRIRVKPGESLDKVNEILTEMVTNNMKLSKFIDARDIELPADELETLNELEDLVDQARNAASVGKVPDAPFRKTWQEFALKNAINIAIEEGFDEIAWTTGDQQFTNYDIRTKVGEIRYWKEGENIGVLVLDLNGNTFGSAELEDPMNEKKLTETFGKAITKRMLEGEGEVVDQEFRDGREPDSEVKSLKDDDLNVGGEGMRRFYDDILVNSANKLIKGIKVDGQRMKVRDLAVDFIDKETKEPIVVDVHAIPITDEVKKLSEQFTLFQGGPGRRRGQITFNGKTADLKLLENANASTFFHEMGHFYLEVMASLAEDPAAPQDIKDDFQTLLDWFGVSSRDEITREHHEKFAEGIETYFLEGKAPTTELQRAFNKFKAWLISVYGNLRRLVNLTPEVRDVMDRLFATDKEIQEAKDQFNMDDPLMTDPRTFGMSDEKARRFEEAREDAERQASETLVKKAMEARKKKQTAEYKKARKKIKEEVTDEINNEKLYIALAILQRGVMPDGSPLPEGIEPVKLNREGLVRDYGAEFVKNSLPKPFIYSRKGGVDYEYFANKMGYDSGDQMIQEMSVALPRKEAIERRTEQRMLEEFPDLIADPAEMEQEAINALHNEKRLEYMELQLQALAENNAPVLKEIIRRTTRRPPKKAQVKERARMFIANMKIRDIKPNKYRQAEARAAKEAGEALAKGDLDAAFQAKQREMFNAALYGEAVKARQAADKTVEYVKKFNKGTVRQKIGLAGGGFLEQIDAILERFDFRKGRTLKSIDRSKTLAEWVRDMADDQKAVDLPRFILDEARKTSWKELNPEQLEELDESLRTIEHLARFKSKLLGKKKRRDLRATVDELVAAAQANTDFVRKTRLEQLAEPKQGRIKGFLKEFFASHTKMEFLFESLDGDEAQGVWWTTLFKPIADAEDDASRRNRESTMILQELLEKYYPRKTRTRDLYIEKIHIPQLGIALPKAKLIAMGLNWGNVHNREALLEGYEWTDAQVNPTTGALSLLDENDWKMIQEIWDYLDTFREESFALDKRVFGVMPKRVEPDSFETKFGTFKGGYYPASYDPNFSDTQYLQDQRQKIMEAGIATWRKPQTKRGHLKERTGSAGKPIELSLNVLGDHISDVIHDLAYREAIINANTIISHPEVKEAIIGATNKETYEMVRIWLKSVAGERDQMQGLTQTERFITSIKGGMAASVMGFKFTTGIVQFTGFSQSIDEIGAKWAMDGLAQFYGNALTNPKEAWEFVASKSEFMKNRAQTFDRDVKEMVRKEGLGEPESEFDAVWRSMTPDVRISLFSHIGMMDMAVSVPTWLGAYNKAFNGNVEGVAKGNEQAAVDYADRTVRVTQGSGSVKDLARIQNGGALLKTFTMFYSFFSMLYQRFAKSFRVFRLSDSTVKGTAKLMQSMFWIWIAPAVVETMILGEPPEDDDEWAEWMIRKVLTYPSQTIVGARDLINFEEERFGYNPSPLYDFGEKLFGLSSDIIDLTAGSRELDEVTAKDAEDLINIFGVVFHLPTRQMILTGRYFIDWMAGEEDPEHIGEAFWRGFVKKDPNK